MKDPEKASTSDHKSIYLPAAERDPCGFFFSRLHFFRKPLDKRKNAWYNIFEPNGSRMKGAHLWQRETKACTKRS